MKDFEFESPDGEILNMYSKDGGVPYYSKWSGRCGMVNEQSSFYVNCSEKMGRHLKSIYDNVEYYSFYNKNECKMSFDKKNVRHLSHIFGFITSYSRIHCLDQLFRIPSQNVVRVNMDGIYYNDLDCEKFEIAATFRNKEDSINIFGCVHIPNNKASDSFIHSYVCKNSLPSAKYNNKINNHQHIMCLGAGGSGKTHANITDLGFVNPFFSTISWKLVTSKTKEYNICGSVIHRLLGLGCENKYEKNPPNVIIIDEATMITEDMKKKILSSYPYSKIVFCGDFDINGTIYQLPPQKGDVMEFQDMKIVKYLKNWRTQDKRLLAVLKILRKAIKMNMNKKDTMRLLSVISRDYNLYYDNIEEEYKIDDVILASRRSCNQCRKHNCDHINTSNYIQEWTNKFKGKFRKDDGCEKYLITKNTQNGLNGEIVISKDQPPNSEIRHAFTNHAIQGETCTTNIYIDPRNLFDPRMVYVGFSRAKFLNQIRITKYVDNKEIKDAEKKIEKATAWLKKYKNDIDRLNDSTNFDKLDLVSNSINKDTIFNSESWGTAANFQWWNDTLDNYNAQLIENNKIIDEMVLHKI
jgi:hypothetical protein